MKKFFGLVLQLSLMTTAIYANTGNGAFSSRDLNRVLYLKTNPSRYLVLQKIMPDGKLRCRIYATRQIVSIESYDAGKTIFYDSTSQLVLSQYALYYRAHRLKNNHAMDLWKQSGDSTGRLEVLNKFDAELKHFRAQLQSIRKKNHKVEDPDDRLDNLHELLDKCKLPEIISGQFETNDFALLIVMYADFHILMLEFEKMDPEKSSLYEAARTMRQELAKQLCDAFSEHNSSSGQTGRREKFLRIYPDHKGARWQKPSPQTPTELTRSFDSCMKSYFALNNLSSITDPQEWSSAVLDVLMLTGGAKCTAGLEKELDNTLEMLEQKNK